MMFFMVSDSPAPTTPPSIFPLPVMTLLPPPSMTTFAGQFAVFSVTAV
jgi:hypothetical protein